MDTQTFTFIAAVVAVIGTVATAIMTFLRTKSSVSGEVIKNYEVLDRQNKEQLEEWKDRTKKCEDLHRENLEKMGNMKGQLDTTLNILKDRNPETTKFMEYLTQVAQRSDTFMSNSGAREEKILNALTQISTFMQSINDNMKPPSPSTTVNVTTPNQPVVS